MRSPERIDKFMAVLTELWKLQPDTRFHQLIYNLKYEFYSETGKGQKKNCYEVQDDVICFSGSVIELYYTEDDVFLNWLENKLQEAK